MMTTTEKIHVIGGLIAAVPYGLIAWAYTNFDPTVSLWAAFGALLAIRLIFSAIEGLSGILACVCTVAP